MVHECFLNVAQFPMRETLFPVSVFVFEMKICLRYTAGKFNENPSMRALAKILRARASEHSSNFCEQFEQRPNFASTFNWDGTIRYPSLGSHPPKGGKIDSVFNVSQITANELTRLSALSSVYNLLYFTNWFASHQSLLVTLVTLLQNSVESFVSQ